MSVCRVAVKHRAYLQPIIGSHHSSHRPRTCRMVRSMSKSMLFPSHHLERSPPYGLGRISVPRCTIRQWIEQISNIVKFAKRGTFCPCRVLDIDHIEDELFAIEVSSEASKPWIRERQQMLLPSLKATESWLGIIDAVAQVNPISGQVSGLVKVALKVSNLIRSREAFEDPSIPASLTLALFRWPLSLETNMAMWFLRYNMLGRYCTS